MIGKKARIAVTAMMVTGFIMAVGSQAGLAAEPGFGRLYLDGGS